MIQRETIVDAAVRRALPDAFWRQLRNGAVTAGWAAHCHRDAIRAEFHRVAVNQNRSHAVPGDVRFHHIGDVLEQLDDSFFWMARLKSTAPDFYDLFSRTGTVIGARNGRLARHYDRDLMPAPVDWPSFMAIAFPGKYDTPRRITPKILCLRKLRRCGDFVPFGTMFYECLLLYTERAKEYTWPIHFFIGVDDAGNIKPLRMITTQSQRLHHRRRGGARHHTIQHRQVAFPEALTLWRDEARADSNDPSLTIGDLIEMVFFSVLSATLSAATGAQINVAQGNLAVQFGIPMPRTSYFFKDRDLQATVNGTRKRIFHEVARHKRTLKSGRAVSVVPHFRGQRRFLWNGYDVCITVPRHHHKPLAEFTVPGVAEEEADARSKYYTAKETATAIRQLIWSAEETRGGRRDLESTKQ